MDNNLNPNNEQKKIKQGALNNKGNKSNTGIVTLLIIKILGLCGYLESDKEIWKKDIDNDNKDSGEIVDKNNEENESRYSSIIEEYRNAINDKDDVNLKEKYPNVNFNYVYDGNNFYYAFYDMDNNGTDELFISTSDSHDGFSDIFTYNGSNPVRLSEVSTYYHRIKTKIYDNGIMYVHFAGSSQAGSLNFYKIAGDGYSLENIGSYDYNCIDYDYSNISAINLKTSEKMNDSSIDDIVNFHINGANELIIDDFNWKKIN